MNINATTLFSKLGNNDHLLPIIVKDSIDNGGRTVMAYKESAKDSHEMGVHDARERFIEENVTSLVWLGGIPLLKKVYDKAVTNKIYDFKQIKDAGTDVLAKANIKLFDKDGVQSAVKNRAIYKDEISKSKVLKSLDNEAEKILKNTGKFKKIVSGKMAFATAIPLALLGYVLPKYNQKLTENIYKKEQSAKHLSDSNKHIRQAFNGYKDKDVFAKFKNPSYKANSLAFKGIGNKAFDIFNNDITSMAILDGGIATGRIATSREKHEGVEKAIKEAGVIFFIYKGGKIVEKGFNKIAEMFKKPIALDSQLLEDKKFQECVVKAAKDSKVKEQMLHFPAEGEKEIIKLIDKEVKSGELKNPTLKAAKKVGLIEIVEGIRHPYKLVDTKEIENLNKEIGKFVNAAAESAEPKKFINKAKNAKRGSILANIALCATATAYVVPKIQYWYREKYAKTAANPGIKNAAAMKLG